MFDKCIRQQYAPFPVGELGRKNLLAITAFGAIIDLHSRMLMLLGRLSKQYYDVHILFSKGFYVIDLFNENSP